MNNRAAKLAAAAARLKEASGRSAPFFLAFLTDSLRISSPAPIIAALPQGAAVILRDYDAQDREDLARRLLGIARPRGVLLLIGADAHLARKIGADGVHLPRWAQAPENSRGLIVSCACHDADELERASHISADVALLSPAFATESHRGAKALGGARFTSLAAAARLPILALGGVDETNAYRLAGSNVAGLGAISAFLPR